MLEPADRVLSREVSAQRALDLAYRYLGRRDRTVVEMRRHLEGKRVEPELIDETIAELLEQRYLDDARYAQRFAEDRRTLDAWGVDRIEQRLIAVGVDRADIAAALAAQPAEAELDAAVELLRRKLREPPSDDRSREKALGMLVRKGYELNVAYDAVRAFERTAA
ncbi:MAG: RecX family transcriptional regulator [Solirubrobacteraceae bacterium]|nr:RecX family transcriptional regulator [Solirubrobacteraceae bacterium]